MEIKNLAIVEKIKTAFDAFKNSKKKTFDDFFGITVLYALKYDANRFNLKPKKIKFNRAIIVFGEGYGEDQFYIGNDFTNMVSESPIEIQIECLFDLLGINQSDIPIEHGPCTIFKLRHAKNSHGKNVIRGHKHHSVPGGTHKNQNLVAIGVWEWPSDRLFWLPSKNLIDDEYRCTKTPSCGFTTLRSQVQIFNTKFYMCYYM